MEERRRDQSLDVLRGLAIFNVLMIHTTAGYVYADSSTLTFTVMNIVNKFFQCAVPIFVTLTVYLALKSGRKLGLSYVLRKSVPLIIMYTIWSAVYIGSDVVMYSAPIPSLRVLILDKFLQGQASFHLYYVVMLVLLYVVIALLSHLPIKRLRPKVWMLPAAVLLQAIIYIAYIKLILQRFWFWNTAIFPLFYILPIVCGIMLAADDERTKKLFSGYVPLYIAAWIFGLAAMAWSTAAGSQAFGGDYIASMIFDTVVTAIYNMGGIPLMFLLAKKLEKISPLSVLGQHSLTIYFAHPLAMYIIEYYGHFFFGTPLWLLAGIMVKAAALVVLSLIYAYAAHKSNTLFKNLRQN